MVCERLIKYTDESSSIYKLLEKLKRLAGQKQENLLDALEARISRRSEEMDNLVRTLSLGNLSPAFVQRVNVRINTLDKELSDLTQERETLQDNVNRMAGQEVQAQLLAGTISSLKDNFALLSVFEKRTLIRLLVQKIVWDGSTFIFLWTARRNLPAIYLSTASKDAKSGANLPFGWRRISHPSSPLSPCFSRERWPPPFSLFSPPCF